MSDCTDIINSFAIFVWINCYEMLWLYIDEPITIHSVELLQ